MNWYKKSITLKNNPLSEDAENNTSEINVDDFVYHKQPGGDFYGKVVKIFTKTNTQEDKTIEWNYGFDSSSFEKGDVIAVVYGHSFSAPWLSNSSNPLGEKTYVFLRLSSLKKVELTPHTITVLISYQEEDRNASQRIDYACNSVSKIFSDTYRKEEFRSTISSSPWDSSEPGEKKKVFNVSLIDIHGFLNRFKNDIERISRVNLDWIHNDGSNVSYSIHLSFS